MPFISRAFTKLQNRSEDIFCHYYSTPSSCEQITFADLCERVIPRTNILRHRVRPEGLLFIIDDDVLEQVSWWLAALLANATPGILTPITSKLDHQKYFTQLDSVLSSYQQAKVLINKRLVMNSKYVEVMEGKSLFVTSKEEFDLAEYKDEDRWIEPQFTDKPLVFQQSSGTTGIRKGMLLTEEMVINQLENYNQILNLYHKKDVIVSWLPLYHDMGLVGCLLQSVYWGIPLVVTSPFVWLESPKWFFHAIRRHSGTISYLPNFAFNVMSQRVAAAEFPEDTLRSLRLLISCSEPVIASSINDFKAKFAPLGLSPNAISSSYAMAENTFAVTQSLPGRGVVTEKIDKACLEEKHMAVIQPKGFEVVSSGQAISNVDIKIVSDGKPCLEGQCGDIYIKSDCQIGSYFGVGEDIAATDDGGWLFTGDIGYLRGGELFVVGRKKDIIIRGGRNINPVDIEEVVGRVEQVKPGRVVAFGVFNEHEGTEDVIVIAEFGGERYSDIDQLRKISAAAVTHALDLTPQEMIFVRPNWLIKSSSGKISRKACKEKYLQLKEKQKTEKLFISEYSLLDEGYKDCFEYFGRDSKIKTPTTITSPGRIKVGNWVSLGMHGKILMQTDFSSVRKYALQHFPEVQHTYDERIYGKRDPVLKIGDCTMIGDFFFISCALSIEIGKHVVMSDRVFITDSNHLYEHLELPISLQSNSLGKAVYIGDHSWIGINAVILEGVRVGKHAIISANSVVTQDVPDYAVVVGNPARVVKVIGGGRSLVKPMAASEVKEVVDKENSIQDTIRRFIAKEFNTVVSENESLFRSGLVDSLGSLRLIEHLEELFDMQLDEKVFFEEGPDTVKEIARFMERQRRAVRHQNSSTGRDS